MIIVIKEEEKLTEEQKQVLKKIGESVDAEIINENDVLDAFCWNEANYRLAEYYDIPESEMFPSFIEDVKNNIKETINGCGYLWDYIDMSVEETVKDWDLFQYKL